MLLISTLFLSFAVFFMWLATTRLSEASALALAESAFYAGLHPTWPRVYVNGQAFALLPEDAEWLGMQHGQKTTLQDLAHALSVLAANDKDPLGV